jgi:hypothetical protein
LVVKKNIEILIVIPKITTTEICFQSCNTTITGIINMGILISVMKFSISLLGNIAGKKEAAKNIGNTIRNNMYVYFILLSLRRAKASIMNGVGKNIVIAINKYSSTKGNKPAESPPQKQNIAINVAFG